MQRLVKYDVMRVLALACVVMCHVSAYIVILMPEPTKIEFIVGNIFNGLTRVAIPLFLMLTGALLLDEKRKFDVKDFFHKHFLALVQLLVFWCAFYIVFYSALYGYILPASRGEMISWTKIVDYIVTLKGMYSPHLWYLFMIVGLYLTIPVLRLFVKKENLNYVLGIIATCVVVKCLGVTLDVFTVGNQATAFLAKFRLEGANELLAYVLLGWVLSNYSLKKQHRMALYIMGSISMLASILIVQYTIAEIPKIRAYTYSHDAIFLIFHGAACFEFIKEYFGERMGKSTFITQLSKMSFGAYIIHASILLLLTDVILPYHGFTWGPWVYHLLIFALAMALSYGIVYVCAQCVFGRRIFYVK